jgi:hypothetical protein
MAGMFYSLQEAAEKLNKTEEEINQLVQDGQLREFRDGPNLLFKVEEVEALLSGTDAILSDEPLESQAIEEIPTEEDAELHLMESEELTPDTPEPQAADPEELTPEIPESQDAELEEFASEILEPQDAESEELAAEILETPDMEPESSEPEVLAPSEQATGTSEILLAPETGAPVPPSDLTDADTALTGEGISVLGETDSGYLMTDDTMAETAVPTGTSGTTPEVPLEEIEEDVNLDTFGSGSGLLDLSLQADDTSLGGILDEIYTSEGEGQDLAPLEGGADSAAEVAAEADEMLHEEPMVPQATPEVPATLAQPFIEAAPDTTSNTLGMLLFLPLLIVIYTMVVAFAGRMGVMPSILAGIQGLIWYIMGGAAGLAVLVTVAAFMVGGGTGKSAAKPKKVKVKKAKKEKKEKKPKKPKKEKKSKSKKS